MASEEAERGGGATENAEAAVVIAGGVASTTHRTRAAWPRLPDLSTAITAKLCAPSARSEAVYGDEQGAHASSVASSSQRKLATPLPWCSGAS